jgi:hypothetical protein
MANRNVNRVLETNKEAGLVIFITEEIKHLVRGVNQFLFRDMPTEIIFPRM